MLNLLMFCNPPCSTMHYNYKVLALMDNLLLLLLCVELSSESGQGQQLSVSDLEVELREMRLSLIMEIEKRKHVEESLNNMRRQWQRIREQLSLVGFTLPEDPTVASGHEQLGCDPAEDLCQQVYLARFVSNTIGRGLIRAEMEMEMEAQVESKNFEIARLMDKLRNYEAMNQEMVQRNQDVLGEISIPYATCLFLDF